MSDDNSARVWKIEEEKQLVYTYFMLLYLDFSYKGASLDTISLINEGTFVTGGQDGYFIFPIHFSFLVISAFG